MHTNNFLVDYSTYWHWIKTLSKNLPNFDTITSLAYIINFLYIRRKSHKVYL
jgi:hypothetical protein